jgi:hypothetical protein
MRNLNLDTTDKKDHEVVVRNNEVIIELINLTYMYFHAVMRKSPTTTSHESQTLHKCKTKALSRRTCGLEQAQEKYSLWRGCSFGLELKRMLK